MKATKEEIIKAYDEMRDAAIEHLELQEKEEEVKLAVIRAHKRLLTAKEAVRGLTGY